MAKLRARYKKHTPKGKSRGTRVQMLVVSCPKHGKVCAAENACLKESYKSDDGVKRYRKCVYWGGLEFGYIICNHPKAE